MSQNQPSTQAFAIGQLLAAIVLELRELVEDQNTQHHFRIALIRPSDGISSALRALYHEMINLDAEERTAVEARIAFAASPINRIDRNMRLDQGEFMRGYLQGIARGN
ncbi:MAG TPA: hypothetical protein VFE34_24830 [Dongiaceae bacterium]|jgi:hypothetical protein|nr:hypothetical protein [Dongiaceae bacterium]